MTSIHDRIALELGRALMRAHAAEAQTAQLQAENKTLSDQLAEVKKAAKPAAATSRTAKG